MNTSLRSGNDFASFFKAKGLDHLSKQLEKLISNLEHVSHVLIEQFCVLIQKIVKQSTHDAINSWDSSIRAQLHDTILRSKREEFSILNNLNFTLLTISFFLSIRNS